MTVFLASFVVFALAAAGIGLGTIVRRPQPECQCKTAARLVASKRSPGCTAHGCCGDSASPAIATAARGRTASRHAGGGLQQPLVQLKPLPPQ